MATFSDTLIRWFQVYKRDLPWRHTKDPYKIWLSEIILQQTRVVQGWDYYNTFIKTYPDVWALAKAPEEEVLRLWQGLGYYSRARNLHATAQMIVSKYNGRFPENYTDLRSLKGIGDYTASAILSFAFDQAYPVLDGNVARFMSRLFGIFEAVQEPGGVKIIKEKLENLIDPKHAADFNQAIMEFGALQCTPRNPVCQNCPFQKECYAFNKACIETLPVKKQKAPLKNRFLHYFVVLDPNQNSILLHKRTENDIWKNLYELPLIESEKLGQYFSASGQTDLFDIEQNRTLKAAEPILHYENELLRACRELSAKFDRSYVQALSHQKLHIYFYLLPADKKTWEILRKLYIEVSFSSIDKYAFPKTIREYLEQLS